MCRKCQLQLPHPGEGGLRLLPYRDLLPRTLDNGCLTLVVCHIGAEFPGCCCTSMGSHSQSDPSFCMFVPFLHAVTHVKSTPTPHIPLQPPLLRIFGKRLLLPLKPTVPILPSYATGLPTGCPGPCGPPLTLACLMDIPFTSSLRCW